MIFRRKKSSVGVISTNRPGDIIMMNDGSVYAVYQHSIKRLRIDPKIG